MKKSERPVERNPDSSCPQLLVSVRNVAEAQEAIVGGCDILDVKEPSRGSLGAASGSTICQISEAAREFGIPLSAAMGECLDWRSPFPPVDLCSISDASLRFVKLGLAGLGKRDDETGEWLCLAGQIGHKLGTGTRHVAVIYADWQAAKSPHPTLILDALATHLDTSHAEPEFAGVLVDTFGKEAGRLTDAMSALELRAIGDRTRDMGLFLALAGRLTVNILPEVMSVSPDIVAIRSAACMGEDRQASVRSEAVARFRISMSDLTAGSQPAAAFDEANHV